MKRLFVAAVARSSRRQKLSLSDIRARAPRRILIVRQHNQMGDMVCATPALRALRRAFPEARLALVTAPVNHEVVRHNPDLDRVLLFDRVVWRSPPRLLRFLTEVRRFRPDLAVVLNSVSFSVTSAWIAAASGAPVIIGGDSRPFGWDLSRHLYSLELPSRPELDRHAVLHNLAPLEAVGIAAAGLDTIVVPAPAERAAAAALLDGLPGDGPLLVIHPGAGKRANLWPAGRFAAIAARAAAAGERVMVLQGPADGGIIARFTAELAAAGHDASRGRIVTAPRQPVGVCAALLARCDRFLCNDTGLMHVAGAVGAPTLALFGPTDPALWKPLSPVVRALRAKNDRLDTLGVEAVWDALRALPARQAGVA
ncbi:MAG: glycosyltransferase family 9 protein [Candidatus Krumholzibacteriia bacterium]